ncbi:hypothetical protein COS55_00150, partial [Candidatus Shapirobacteria bacterium CG03_land_8_20_14_0_80_40_19]
TECCPPNCCSKRSVLRKHLLVLGVLVVLAAVLGYFFRDRLLVAIVNGKPVFRYKLNQLLVKSSGKEALENLIVEGLIKEEVKKNQVVITKEDIDGEIKKISAQFGDVTKFEEVLKAQGMSKEDFQSQIETKLQVYGILGKDITVSEDEISQFLKENGETMTATSEAEKRTEANGVLREQKINEKVQTWISDLLAKAKITRFLK